MKKITKLLIYSVLFVGLICPVYGQSTATSFDARFVVQFPVGKSEISPNFRSNYYAIEELKRFFNTVDISMIDSISIIGSSSPEGDLSLNLVTAYKRTESLRNFIKAQYPFVPMRLIHLSSKGDTWADMMKMIKRDPYFPNKNHTLIVLGSELNYERRFELIKFLEYKESYDYLHRYIFPRLRNATAFIVHYKSATPFVVYDTQIEFERRPEFIEKPAEVMSKVVSTDNTLHIPNVVPDVNSIQPATSVSSLQAPFFGDSNDEDSGGRMRAVRLSSRYDKMYKPLFAFKTNLLFNAASLVNIGIEVPIGDHFSIAGEVIFPWWLNEDKQNALQLLNVNLEAKYWFKPRVRSKGFSCMTGWFTGVYAGTGYYDLEYSGIGYQGESFTSFGVMAGYAHSIGKSLRIEYSLGVGYMQTNYRKYEARMMADNNWSLIRRETGVLSWVGPTQAKISFVWLLNRSYSKKGGVR